MPKIHTRKKKINGEDQKKQRYIGKEESYNLTVHLGGLLIKPLPHLKITRIEKPSSFKSRR
jgi:hypothetical protein